MVSKTREDLPEPDTPVKIVIFLLGILRDTFFRLFSRAPLISMYSCAILASHKLQCFSSVGPIRAAPDTPTPTAARAVNVNVHREAALPALQLGDLDEVAAGVVHHRDLRGGHIGRRHGELGAARFHALVIGLQVAGEEHSRGLALLK